MRVEMELRNLRRQRVLEYLIQAGGQADGDEAVSGEGWSAQLVELEAAQVGSISVSRDLLVIEGDAPAVERVRAFMEIKTMRGGG